MEGPRDDAFTASQICNTEEEYGSQAQLPLRPCFGTQGNKVQLWTNHLEIRTPLHLDLFRYSVDITTDLGNRIPTGRKLKRIIQLLLDEKFALLGTQIATDFKSSFVSRVELDLKREGYLIRCLSENKQKAPPQMRSYHASIRFVGKLSVPQFLDYLGSKNPQGLYEAKDEMLQAMNIVLGHRPKSIPTIITLGSNRHYDMAIPARERFSLGAGLFAVNGLFKSVRAAASRVLLNIQVTTVAMYEDGPLERSMHAYLEENGDRYTLASFFEGVSIDLMHVVRKNPVGVRVPHVKDIAGLATPTDGEDIEHPPRVPEFGAGSKQVEFYLRDLPGYRGEKQCTIPQGGRGRREQSKNGFALPSTNGYISVYEFFKQRYHITIRDPSLPVVNVGTRQNPVYLPPQVCHILPGQVFKGKLSSAQVQRMIRHAVRTPAENARFVVATGVQMLGLAPANNSSLSGFGLTVDPRLITVPGRSLQSPHVRYSNRDIPTRLGSWNMDSAQFLTKAQLSSWTYLWISKTGARDPWSNSAELKQSIDAFAKVLHTTGICVEACVQGLKIFVDSQNLSVIDDTIHRLASNSTPPKLLLVILPPGPNTDFYNRVKYVCDVKEGMVCVCVVASKFARRDNTQYFANIALKVNLKLGGRNHTLHRSELGIVGEGQTMIVGIDVTHPSPGSPETAPSVAGVVASVDQWLCQWPATIQLQPRRMELIQNLSALIQSRLHLWRKHNNAYPRNILVYRDGVSESQYRLVLDQELPALQDACKKIYPTDLRKDGFPRITIVIVGKRHQTRFYPMFSRDADKSANPKSGTVVDRGVTEFRNWDFFLQAHTAIRGTARPAHYYVIYDQIFRFQGSAFPAQNAADALENLTHNLCYLCGRATKAISICPPVYYADLVCTRARCYLSGLSNPSSSSLSTSGAFRPSEQQCNPNEDSGLIGIHERVREVMFYV